jgi:glycosyltransferase involved in cell wall biosynthesis
LVFTVASPACPRPTSQTIQRLLDGGESAFSFIHLDPGHEALYHPERYASWTVSGAFVAKSSVPGLWRFNMLFWYRAALRRGLVVTASKKFDVVLGWFPNMAFTLAAVKVAARRRLPLVLYLNDLYTEARANPLERLWARWTEPSLFRQAAEVVYLTSGLQRHYQSVRGKVGVLIPHCVTAEEVARALALKPSLDVKSPVQVTYAGHVYQARLDSLLAVLDAVRQLNQAGIAVQLNLLGNNNAARLAGWGLQGPWVTSRFVKEREEFIQILRDSDMLLSTVAFQSDYPLQDQTCFPTKTFDYFLAGKPILVVAPPDTDYSNYMKTHGCGSVVESLHIPDITQAIRRLAQDGAHRAQLVAGGYARLRAHQQQDLQPMLQKVLRKAVRWQTT